MIQAIGDLLPSAFGVAISPVPIIAVILMLGTPKAKVTGSAFAVGWIGGLVIASAVVLVVASGASEADSAASTGVNWFQVAMGALFLFLAVKQWRGRPKAGEQPELPAWMAAIDTFTPAKSLGLGAVLSGVNPKNLALTAAAAASIAQAGLGGADSAVAVAVFVVIGSLTVAGPVLFYLASSERAAGPLGSIKDFMSDHNSAIMMILFVVLGAKLLGQGVGALGG